MKKDPIVEEVHKVREEMWDQCGGDMDRLIQSFRDSEALHRDRIISKDEFAKLRQKRESASDLSR